MKLLILCYIIQTSGKSDLLIKGMFGLQLS